MGVGTALLWPHRQTARRSRPESSTHYAVLGVPPDAREREIVSAYRRCAKRLHPDVNPDPAALEQFTSATAAYETLVHPVRRERYDASLATTTAPTTRPVLISERFEDGLIGGFVSLAGIGVMYVLALLVAR